MKRALLIIFAVIVTATAYAQNDKRNFSKERFKTEMRNYIIKEAKLTEKETAAFFPIFDKMKDEQRAIYRKMREVCKQRPTTEKECADAIKKHDELDLEFKKIQQTYNNKLMKVVPASKLFDAIKAEDRFYRKALNNYNKRNDKAAKNQNRGPKNHNHSKRHNNPTKRS